MVQEELISVWQLQLVSTFIYPVSCKYALDYLFTYLWAD